MAACTPFCVGAALAEPQGGKVLAVAVTHHPDHESRNVTVNQFNQNVIHQLEELQYRRGADDELRAAQRPIRSR